MENQNSFIIFLKIEITIQIFSINKTTGLNGFIRVSYQIFKEKVMSLTQIFTKTEEGMLSNSLDKFSKTLLPKADKDITQKLSAKLNPTRYHKNDPF